MAQYGLCENENAIMHIKCVGLDYVPEVDWLCPKCIALGYYIISGVHDKRLKNNKVEYLVSWVGENGAASRTWQQYAQIPPAQRPKVNAYRADQPGAR